MNKSNLKQRLIYSMGITSVFFIIQFIYGNMTDWYFYLLFFILNFSFVSSNLWKNKLAPWIKKRDKKRINQKL